MLAFLKLIPFRDYVYAVIIAALLVFVGICKHDHTVVKEVKQVGTAAEKVVKADDAVAEKSETQSALIYKQIVRIPDVPDIGIVCEHAGSGSLPASDTVAGASAGERPADSGDGHPYDPSGAALTRAKAADAQIAYLQRRVKELEKQMNDAP